METKNSAQVQTNIPNASLSSYEPVKISLADAPSAEAEQLEGYKRAMAAMELAMRVCGDIDPAHWVSAPRLKRRPRRRGRLFLQYSSIRRSLSSSTSA
mgnify:CR=1 FL=1